MAFGWKTEYEKRVPADGLTNWEIFSILEKACKDLEWEFLIVDEKTFTATTPTHWTLSEEIITIKIENETILFKSQSESLELYEAGRNQKNIEEHLLPSFRKIKWGLKAEELQKAAMYLQNETVKQLKSGNRVDGERITFGFKDHEITFFLIAIMVLAFVAMVIRGVDAFDPLVEDIIKWGGSLKYNVTGGEWWRLITATFVHIGIYPLLANIFGIYFVGLMVESILGKLKFLIAFICCGVLASLISMLWVADGVTAGASGAIFGMYGVLLAFSTTKYVNKKFSTIWLAGIAIYAVFNIYMGFKGGTDNAENLGGFAAGILIGYLFYFYHFKKNVARAGGSRISIEVLLLTALLVFAYNKKYGKDDSLQFEKAVMKLNQIELKAMTLMQQLQQAEDNIAATKVLKDSALPEWKHFQKEIMKTDKYTLDETFKRKRKLLNEYAGLRVRQTELIYRSVNEGTDKYNNEINQVSDTIDKIIDQIGN